LLLVAAVVGVVNMAAVVVPEDFKLAQVYL
jgi:hypothetical protein